MIYNRYAFTVPEEKMIRVITDTDAKNEADDQFAVVQALLSPRFDNAGFIAAHFGTTRVAESMEASYGELETIFAMMGFPSKGMLYHGARRPQSVPSTPVDSLRGVHTPPLGALKRVCTLSQTTLREQHTPTACGGVVDSEGARLIIAEAMKDDPRPLYVTFLGPLTDLADAWLLEPRIAGRLTAIWIGGGAYPAGGQEFNLGNDIHAANTVFASPITLWQIPKNVYEMMAVSLAELEQKLYGQGEIGKYLLDQLARHSQEAGPRKSAFRTGETWVLGDNPAVGLLLYEHRFEFEWLQAPEIGSDMNYIHTGRNRPIRVYKRIDSRLVLEDMFAKIRLFHRNYPGGWVSGQACR